MCAHVHILEFFIQLELLLDIDLRECDACADAINTMHAVPVAERR